MSGKNLTLSLGGREQELKFGKMSFLKHLGRVSNGYNFIQAGIIFDPGKIYESVLYFVWAGLHDANLTREQVEDMVDDLSFEEMMNVQYHAWAAMSGKTIEEIKNPLAQVSSNGAAV